MHPLTRFQALLYYIGGALLVVGALLPLFVEESAVMPGIFGLGALLFCSMQLLQRYEGHNIVIRRLRRQQILGCCALLIAAALLFCSHYHVSPFTGGEWKIALSIGALLEVYTAFRLPAEMEKEA